MRVGGDGEEVVLINEELREIGCRELKSVFTVGLPGISGMVATRVRGDAGDEEC